MTVLQAQAFMERMASKFSWTKAEREAVRKAAQVIRYGRRKRNPPTLEQATAARLAEIADVAESGFTEMTGKGRRESGREGEFIGRFKGMKGKAYPELVRISAGPKAIAAAIRRGKGKVFEQVQRAAAAQMEKEGFSPARKRSPGRRTVPPHSGAKYCSHCKADHTKGQHRFHGPGSFHATHAWAFNPPPVVIYRRVLMIQAQKQGPHRCDAECKRCNHCYFHEFKPGAVMYGLPNGDILIRSTK